MAYLEISDYVFSLLDGLCGTNSFWASMMRSTLSAVEAVEGGTPRISLKPFAIVAAVAAAACLLYWLQVILGSHCSSCGSYELLICSPSVCGVGGTSPPTMTSFHSWFH